MLAHVGSEVAAVPRRCDAMNCARLRSDGISWQHLVVAPPRQKDTWTTRTIGRILSGNTFRQTGMTEIQRPDLAESLQKSVAASRKEFVNAMAAIRPRLHKFCTRMCGSPFDGEDVVQEVLADAFYNLSSLKDTTKFESWIFRIAYNKCIDFLRRSRARAGEVPFGDEHDVATTAGDDAGGTLPTDEALATLIGELPPKERAALLLKDVLDYSLSETAEVIDSTIGGVKAALHRARTKLHATPATQTPSVLDPQQRRLFAAYAECFNRRDWHALGQLVRADARLEIVGEALGNMAVLGATYHTNYDRLPWDWRLSAGIVGGELVVLHSRKAGDTWLPYSAIRLEWDHERVVSVRDYIHVGYLLALYPTSSSV